MKKFLRIMLAAAIIVMSLASVMGTAVSASSAAVASIGNTTYPSLNEAVEAAQDGDTITVLSNIDGFTGSTVSGKSITVVGAEKFTITAGAKFAFTLLNDADITIENLSFTGYASKNLILYGPAGGSDTTSVFDINLKNVNVEFTASGAIYGYACKSVNLRVEDCTFTGGAAANAIINASVAPAELCTYKFVNTTINTNNNFNSGSKGTWVEYLDPADADEMANDEAAIAAGAVARIGETASGKIGEVYFTDLAMAAAAAQDNSTIYVLNDIEGFGGASLSAKTLKFVGVNKYTITPSASTKVAFTILNNAGIVVENLSFEGYTGKNFIVVSSSGSSGGEYSVTVKDTSVDFRASGAIYGYSIDNLVINLENCVFNAGQAGDCVLNFTSASCYVETSLNLKNVALNENCGITTAHGEAVAISESFTSDAAAAAAGITLRVGATEGGKVGEVYFRAIDAATVKGLAAGTKLTVLCTCGATTELTEGITCETKVACTCGKEIANIADHSYEPATCVKKSVCEWCEEEIGELADHDYTDATCAAKSKCKVCGEEVGNLLKHRDKDNDGKCDNCDANMNGEADTQKPADSGATTTAAGEEKKGCGGTVTVAGLALVAALGSCAIFVEKKRK